MRLPPQALPCDKHSRAAFRRAMGASARRSRRRAPRTTHRGRHRLLRRQEGIRLQEHQPRPRRGRRVRVAKVRPTHARVRAAGIGCRRGPGVVGQEVPPSHGAQNSPVLAELVQQRGLHLIHHVPRRVWLLAVDRVVVAGGHDRGGCVLPLRALAPVGETHTCQLGAAAQEVVVLRDEAAFRRGPQGEFQGGALAAAVRVHLGEEVPELRVRRDGGAIGPLVGAPGLTARRRGVGVGVLGINPEHVAHELRGLFHDFFLTEHPGEREHVDVVLRRPVAAPRVLRPAREAAQGAFATRLPNDGMEDVVSRRSVARASRGRRIVREGHRDPRVVARVDEPLLREPLLRVGGAQQLQPPRVVVHQAPQADEDVRRLREVAAVRQVDGGDGVVVRVEAAVLLRALRIQLAEPAARPAASRGRGAKRLQQAGARCEGLRLLRQEVVHHLEARAAIPTSGQVRDRPHRNAANDISLLRCSRYLGLRERTEMRRHIG
mmetsp:Transcript_8489/g.24415  ORF Transcript_8489/g.24415 Transcript_8489/m.24415 type:complete len:490 (+) Transcript_8489:486-1955(+)